MPARAEAWRRASPAPSESSTKPYRFPGLNHFSLPRTVGAGGSPSCVSASCGGTSGGLKGSLLSPPGCGTTSGGLAALSLCFSDNLPSTLTNQSASLYDEIPYHFEHTRLRKLDSRCSMSTGQLPRRGENLPEGTAKKHAEADSRRVGGNSNREMSDTLRLLKSPGWFSIR
jgi:hypothetical protein